MLMLQTLQLIPLLQGVFVLSILFINRSKYKITPFWLLFIFFSKKIKLTHETI